MASVSLCMIVKNEEHYLPGCLDSVKGIADEIILVDTGSTDSTRKIGERSGAKIYSFQWIDDFSAARNFSFSKATKEFILWLDADDVFLPNDREKLIWRKEQLSSQVDVVMMNYHVDFDPQGKPTHTYYRERLVRRGADLLWQDPVHETINYYGRKGEMETWDVAVSHRRTQPSDPGRNLRIMEKVLEEKGRLKPRMQYYYGRELYYAGRYEDAVQVLKQFLIQKTGWSEDRMGACQVMSYCLEAEGRLEEAQRVLFHSMIYGAPGAEICCQLGRLLLNQRRYRTAAYWFEAALTCRMNDRIGGFVQPYCYGYLPYVQLCRCYNGLGELERAGWCKQQAAKYYRST